MMYTTCIFITNCFNKVWPHNLTGNYINLYLTGKPFNMVDVGLLIKSWSQEGLKFHHRNKLIQNIKNLYLFSCEHRGYNIIFYVVASWSLRVANFFYHDPLNKEGTHFGGGGVAGHREATRLGVQFFMEYFNFSWHSI